MAAAPASQLNPETTPDYFGLFGLSRRLCIDRAALERRFYEISRETHPDRFAAAGPEAMRLAVERMSLLNEAYRTLKDPSELRHYFLKLEGFGSDAPGGEKKSQQIPAELAESWFELQDALMESPAEAAAKISEFESHLAGLKAKAAEDLLALERSIDDAHGPAPRELLQKLSDGVRAQSYLQSLERDVKRIRS